ncbi:MAG: hypothetical protein IK076_02305 [Bacteroidales bacterium]|nr:hypothetical protein [Bacteroidales bacterium]
MISIHTVKYFFAAALSAVLLAGCSGKTGSALEVVTPSESTGVELEGMGVQLDPHFISQNVTRDDGATLEDWYDIVVRRVKMMDIQRFRVMLLPHWWEPVKGQYIFDNTEMKSLYAVLDLAEETGAKVTLVVWGCQAYCSFIDPSTPGNGQRYFNCSPEGRNWVTAPEDNEEFASNFSTLVKYLIEEKGYTCINEVTPFNEPDGKVCELDQYIEIVKAMDRKFREDGIRDKVKFNLSDNIDGDRPFLVGTAENVGEYADIFNSHTYIFGYETPNGTSMDWEKKNLEAVAKTGKKHLIGEFGSNLCVGASRQTDINWYKRGPLIVRNCLNFLNAGAAGTSYWSLIDQYYGRNASYGEMQQLGLWRYKISVYQGADAEDGEYDYQVRPNYYAYSLLTRFIRKGDRVYPLDLKNDFAAGSALLSEDGKWTYVFSNGSEEDLEIGLSNGNKGGMGRCKVYRYTEDSLPSDDSMIAPSGTIRARGGRFTVAVPSQSVILLRQQ